MRKRLLLVLFLLGLTLISLIIWFLNSSNVDSEYQLIPDKLPTHYNGEQFAGSESCIPCHENIYLSHLQTAHNNTSAPANEKTLLGRFEDDHNKVKLIGSQVSMIRNQAAHYQRTEVFGRITSVKNTPISVVIGSGTKGQSHLSWQKDSLYQLQASYFTATNDWMNSPGFPEYPFRRPVTDDCIKCHVTFARNKNISGKTNVYDKNSIIYGISCERCHGPLQEHVVAQSENSSTISISGVTKIKKLNRQLQLDICAQCHSGLRAVQSDKNPFAYVAGDKIDDYSKNYYSARPNANLDVHGNQYGLLKSSECFKSSQTMTCTTCHNPHANQRDRTDYFNRKCQECHSKSSEYHRDQIVSSKKSNDCISCHMPVFPSKTMKVRLNGKDFERSIGVRTHLIGVYVDNLLKNK